MEKRYSMRNRGVHRNHFRDTVLDLTPAESKTFEYDLDGNVVAVRVKHHWYDDEDAKPPRRG